METLARAINDGDIKEDTSDEELEYYADDEEFAELMSLFLDIMSNAKNDGGLYIDGIVSK